MSRRESGWHRGYSKMSINHLWRLAEILTNVIFQYSLTKSLLGTHFKEGILSMMLTATLLGIVYTLETKRKEHLTIKGSFKKKKSSKIVLIDNWLKWETKHFAVWSFLHLVVGGLFYILKLVCWAEGCESRQSAVDLYVKCMWKNKILHWDLNSF